ncbi:HAMP domain-containing histidine kinase [Aerococcaceae bacterium NML210727]|nr:HAMP domain-containing histidine kinase [Aerococcaceae bacterium NML210727]MCW6654475.1 HAMP domain-containing histidine kinase [Aerococcaceae bacterium NML201296]MCW6667117.1 HAMP domain-containing histidine kinase [Aerococcaceae bacterium NML190938]
MKVLWQQIIGFLVVLTTALAISAFRISEYVTQGVYDEVKEQLLYYGNNIIQYNFTRSDLIKLSALVADSGIDIQVYLKDGRIIYPTYNNRVAARLTEEDLATLAKGQPLDLRQTRRFGENNEIKLYVAVFLPYRSDQSDFPPGFVGLSAPLEQLNHRVSAAQQEIYVSFFAAGALGLVMSILYAYYQTRKIKTLQRATRQITSGNYDVHLSVDSKDEFGELARDFEVMAQSLLRSQEEIKRQEKLRRQFMMDAAHEMRTPLTTMSGVVEGLQHDLIPEGHRARSLELIGRETQRLIRLVNENLDYEKIRSNQLILKKQTISGATVLQQIKQQMEEKAKEKGNVIQVECAEDFRVYADYDRLVQVLINLVTNAIQFSQEGRIWLIGRMHDTYAEIAVADEGIGIDTEHIESIWERFYKADVSRKNTKFGESGIGLAVVKSLVEAHGGTVEVASQLGQGTTFTLRFPHEDK